MDNFYSHYDRTRGAQNLPVNGFISKSPSLRTCLIHRLKLIACTFSRLVPTPFLADI